MADKPLNADAIAIDASTLRRRARRRLVGAVAIALTAVVVVPLLFDPDPKPLGDDVEISIPAPDTPFEPLPSATEALPEAAQTEAQLAEATVPNANDSASTDNVGVAKTHATPSTASPETPAIKPAVAPAAKAAPTPAPTPAPKPELKSEPKPDSKPAPKPESKPEPKPTAKPADSKNANEPKTASKPAQADAAFASKGFYLQLGAFSSQPNAQALLKKVNEAGFSASMLSTNGQFRVRVGPIPERDKAEQMAAKLKEKGLKPLMIGP
jgi:DedD protein